MTNTSDFFVLVFLIKRNRNTINVDIVLSSNNICHVSCSGRYATLTLMNNMPCQLIAPLGRLHVFNFPPKKTSLRVKDKFLIHIKQSLSTSNG